jgi:hypothetical protein
MTVHPFARLLIFGSVGAAVLTAGACASSQFNRALDAHQWSDAARAFDADTALLHNESALFQAAMLYSFPNRGTYDPARARTLFEQLLRLYPTTPKRQTAIDHLSLLYELQRTENTAQARAQALEAKIAQLAADTMVLRARLDSIAVRLRAEQDQTALLRKVATRLENDLQDRETQLHALYDELDHLKAIDLKPSLRSKIGDTGNRGKSVPVR